MDIFMFRKKYHLTDQKKFASVTGYSLECIRSYDCNRRPVPVKLERFCELYAEHEDLKHKFNDELNKITMKMEKNGDELKYKLLNSINNFDSKINTIERSKSKKTIC